MPDTADLCGKQGFCQREETVVTYRKMVCFCKKMVRKWCGNQRAVNAKKPVNPFTAGTRRVGIDRRISENIMEKGIFQFNALKYPLITAISSL